MDFPTSAIGLPNSLNFQLPPSLPEAFAAPCCTDLLPLDTSSAGYQMDDASLDAFHRCLRAGHNSPAPMLCV